MAPIGFVILTLITAQLVGISGLGAYFPWAIPGLNTVPEGTEGMELVPASYVIVILTSIIGFFGTIRWWNKADHH
jgi:ABC-2 type transport system permease protein